MGGDADVGSSQTFLWQHQHPADCTERGALVYHHDRCVLLLLAPIPKPVPLTARKRTERRRCAGGAVVEWQCRH
eukprot:3504431-Rhodomonas_salina.1